MADKQKFRNLFIWLIILLLFVGVFSAFHTINNIYKPSFPYNSSLSWSNEHEVNVTCGSLRSYKVPVSGDFFSCNATAVDLDLSDEYPIKDTLQIVKALILHYPESERSEEPKWKSVGTGGKKNNEDSSVIYDIRVPIEPGFNEFQLEFYVPYLNEEGRTIEHIFHARLIKYEAISLEEYNRRQWEKYTLMIAIATVIIMFLSLVKKTLMDLWGRKK